MNADDRVPVVVLMPLYEDWDALPALLHRLEKTFTDRELACEIVIADDGSQSQPDLATLKREINGAIRSVTMLRLGRNLGHQRAIAIGLTYINAERPCSAVVVMDSDGEDAPEDVPHLLEASWRTGSSIVFAGRAKRSEGFLFRILYRCYLLLYRVLTGSSLSFGNFSVIPARLLPRLVTLSELWNHYPAAALRARLSVTTVPIRRARRLSGRSRMNLVSLILHGLSAISVKGDVVGVRALLVTLMAIAVTFVGIVLVVAIRLTTSLAIPGWATYAFGLLVVILLHMTSLALVFVFTTLHSRNYSTFMPRREYRDFIAEETRYHS